MKKYLLIGSGAILMAAIVMIVLAVMNLGSIIKTATETYGPQITKTDVKLGSADISVLSGSGTLKDFLLGNPQGFTMPSALTCGTIRVKVDTGSLTSNTIVIDEIFIDAPVVSYEKKGATDNFKTILANIQKTVASDEKAGQQGKDDTQKSDTGAEKNIQINNFIVKNGKINLGGSLLNAFGDQGVGIALPDIHLKDIGKEKKTTPAEAFAIVLGEMTGDVAGTVTEVGKQLKEQLGKAVEGVTDKAGSALKGLFGGSE
ncbi:MAG: hypothetical protein V3571_03390 [Pseudodesulfovibrio sp.]